MMQSKNDRFLFVYETKVYMCTFTCALRCTILDRLAHGKSLSCGMTRRHTPKYSLSRSPDFREPRAHLVMSNNESTLTICCFRDTAAENPEFFPPDIMLRMPATPVFDVSISSLERTRFEFSITMRPEQFSVPSPDSPEAENVMSSTENF